MALHLIKGVVNESKKQVAITVSLQFDRVLSPFLKKSCSNLVVAGFLFFYWYFLLLQLWAQGGGCKSSIFHPGIECNFTLMMTLMISKMIIIIVLMMRMVLMMMLELVAVLTESHSDFTLLTGLGNQTSSCHVAIAWLLQHLVTLAISSINQVSSCHSYSITVSTILPGKKLIFNLAMKFTN